MLTGNEALAGIEIGLEIMNIAVMAVFLFAVLADLRSNRVVSTLFIGVLIAAFCIPVFDLTTYLLAGSGQLAELRWALFFREMAVIAYEFLLFLYITNDIRKRTFISEGTLYGAAVFWGTLLIVWSVGLFQEPSWFYVFSPDGAYTFRNTHYILGGAFLLFALFEIGLLISCRKKMTRGEGNVYAAVVAIPVIVGLLSRFLPECTYFVSIGLMTTALYIEIYAERIHESAALEKELNESKTKLMISQIQPHFMYNSLNSIYYLIGSDPDTAREATSRFSDYLRQNINSLKNDEPIPMEEELAHTKAYLYLEQLRFGDRIRIEYDIRETGFKLPPLTLQPLVENAVKHGLARKAEGGTILIQAKRENDNFVVIVMDDGVGFEAGKFKDDESTHIGIFNVRSRLRSMVGGNLRVVSTPGKGTVCTMSLPREYQPVAPKEKPEV